MKKLRRSAKEAMLGGVCGGIAEYFETDPVVIRLLFVLGVIFTGGGLIFAYIIFMFVIPQE